MKGATYRIVRNAAMVFAALAVARPQWAQDPQPDANPVQQSDVILRQTVRRVRVDVIVTDRLGQPVTGLQASDFKVSEDGKPQSVRQFEWNGAEYGNAPQPPAQLPPHTFLNLPSEPERGPLTVLLYDVLNTPVDAQPYAHEQMLKFLKRSARQQIAIFVLSDRLHLLQGFTSARDVLLHAARGAGVLPQQSPWSSNPTVAARGAPVEQSEAAQGSASVGGQPSGSIVTNRTTGDRSQMADLMSHIEALESSAMLDRRVDTTMDAFAQIGRFVAGIPGRKNVLWFSGSFPAGVAPDQDASFRRDDGIRNYSGRMRDASILLNSAQVALYPVDSRGLSTDRSFDASQPGSYSVDRAFAQRLFAEHASMDDMAERTGGRAFYNTNGLEQALEASAEDGASYYSLVYAPSNANFDGSLRRISVTLERQNYRLRYRRNYFADDSAKRIHRDVTSEAENALIGPLAGAVQFGAPPAHEIIFSAHVDAIGAPTLATAAQMAALHPYLEQAARAARRKVVKAAGPILVQKYVIQYSVLASQLDFLTTAKSAYRPHVSLVALAFNAEGETLCGIETRIEDSIPASRIDSILENGYRPLQTFLVPVGATVLRLAVRDELSGRVGSMEIRLPLSPGEPRAAE